MKFENTEVFNLEGALRGMRNPMDSWDKSDSYFPTCRENKNILGENDLRLAQSLIRGGTEHGKFLRQIFIGVDITAPRYWWSEFDTYKIGTTANSCSTMHKLKSYPITYDMFDIDTNSFNVGDTVYWECTIHYLESLRKTYNETNDYKYFRLLKQSLPESFLQKRTWTANYETVRSMFHQRKNHRLSEWSKDFCKWVKLLPYAEELIVYNG